mgnify:FL=1
MKHWIKTDKFSLHRKIELSHRMFWMIDRTEGIWIQQIIFTLTILNISKTVNLLSKRQHQFMNNQLKIQEMGNLITWTTITKEIQLNLTDMKQIWAKYNREFSLTIQSLFQLMKIFGNRFQEIQQEKFNFNHLRSLILTPIQLFMIVFYQKALLRTKNQQRDNKNQH